MSHKPRDRTEKILRAVPHRTAHRPHPRQPRRAHMSVRVGQAIGWAIVYAFYNKDAA